MSASGGDGFTQKRTEPCEDCLIRDDLDMVGQVRKDRHGRVKDCQNCKGRGRVKREKRTDPYWTGR